MGSLQSDCPFFLEFIHVITVTSRHSIIQNEHVEQCSCIAARSLMRKGFVSIKNYQFIERSFRLQCFIWIFIHKRSVVGQSCYSCSKVSAADLQHQHTSALSCSILKSIGIVYIRSLHLLMFIVWLFEIALGYIHGIFYDWCKNPDFYITCTFVIPLSSAYVVILVTDSSLSPHWHSFFYFSTAKLCIRLKTSSLQVKWRAMSVSKCYQKKMWYSGELDQICWWWIFLESWYVSLHGWVVFIIYSYIWELGVA